MSIHWFSSEMRWQRTTFPLERKSNIVRWSNSYLHTLWTLVDVEVEENRKFPGLVSGPAKPSLLALRARHCFKLFPVFCDLSLRGVASCPPLWCAGWMGCMRSGTCLRCSGILLFNVDSLFLIYIFASYACACWSDYYFFSLRVCFVGFYQQLPQTFFLILREEKRQGQFKIIKIAIN